MKDEEFKALVASIEGMGLAVTDVRKLIDHATHCREALFEALQGLYNPFEPNNQSNTYKRVKAVFERSPPEEVIDNGV